MNAENDMTHGNDLAAMIVEKALDSGYDNCGIIPIAAIDGYADKLAERKARFPESTPIYNTLENFTKIRELYPWAKSIIVCSIWQGKYKYPKPLRGKYAKSFLLSVDTIPNSSEFKKKCRFEDWLCEQGIRFCGGMDNLPTRIFPLRLAAVEAGLGIFRRNNFFYGEKGSYYALEGYLIDKALELRQKCNIRPCSDKCPLCRRACKTGALAEPYAMNPISCVSFWTTFGGGAVPPHLREEQLGTWICGCDDCQDACPYNRHDWDDGLQFPGLDEIVDTLSPENIISTSDETLIEKVIPKTDFHIPADKVDILRICARRAVKNEQRNGDQATQMIQEKMTGKERNEQIGGHRK